VKLKPGRKSAEKSRPQLETRDGIFIRLCHGIKEFEACLRVEREVWGSADIDVVPVPLFVVAAETGGQVIGAFHNNQLVGFTMAIVGWRNRKPLLHSHMTAVQASYRDRGIGRRLKLFQRQEALSRGISLIEWTFDPLIVKNAYFNFMRLGAVARRYIPNAYGITTSPLHSGMATDRLVAEWHLRSERVRRVIAGKRATPVFSARSARIPVASDLGEMKTSDPVAATRVQAKMRAQFQAWQAKGYAATAIAPGKAGVDYILEPWKSL